MKGRGHGWDELKNVLESAMALQNELAGSEDLAFAQNTVTRVGWLCLYIISFSQPSYMATGKTALCKLSA